MAHPLLQRWSWPVVDAKVNDPDLDAEALGRQLGATPAAIEVFVKVRLWLLGGRSTLPGDRIEGTWIEPPFGPLDAVVYERVCHRLEELRAGGRVSDLDRVTADPHPLPLSMRLRWIPAAEGVTQ